MRFGPSGCGKTTLLNIISGLLTPTRGRVLYNGTDMTALPPEKRNIAQVFQFPVLYDTKTVYENLAFPLQNRRLEKEAITAGCRKLPRFLNSPLSSNKKRTGWPRTPNKRYPWGAAWSAATSRPSSLTNR